MKAIILAAVALALSVSHASAVSLAVKLACKADYFAHCSMHSPGSTGVRKCMRAVGPRLSARCIGALADAGMIKSSKVASKKSAKANKQFAQKAASKKKYASKARPNKKYAAKPARSKKAVVAARKQAPQRVAAERRQSKKRYANRQLKRYASWD
jgi:hypothetical protein